MAANASAIGKWWDERNGGKTMPLTSDINKKDMTEEDIKNRFVTPALNQAGWENL